MTQTPRQGCTVLPDINPGLSSPQPCSGQPVPKRWDDNLLVNMPIKVLFVLRQKKALSQPPGAHVSECFELANYLGALSDVSVTTGVSVLHIFCVNHYVGFCSQPKIL